MTYPNGGKFILIYMSISQNKGMLSHDESRKIVSRIKKTFKKHKILLLSYSFFRCLPLQIVHVFHHVSLEIRGLSALVVAVSTGKWLLTSVRSRVSF